jgi:hypothetical protein
LPQAEGEQLVQKPQICSAQKLSGEKLIEAVIFCARKRFFRCASDKIQEENFRKWMENRGIIWKFSLTMEVSRERQSKARIGSVRG